MGRETLILICKSGFTIAEVLITLGIIGVVATITMSSLIEHKQKQETSIRLKNFYSIMQQAILHSEIDNGSVKYWSKPDVVYLSNGSYDSYSNDMLADKFYDNYLADYIKIIKRNYVGQRKTLQIYLPDGTTVQFGNGGCIDMLVDTNGERKPNWLGYDRFAFLLCPKKTPSFGAYLYYEKYTRNQAIQTCKQAGQYCSYVLQLDNWEFKDDYQYPSNKRNSY